jgi:NitT/TauT family transport system substrate-binding protein
MSGSRLRSRRMFATLAVLAATGAVAGCASESDSTGTASSADAAAPKNAEKVRLIQGTDSLLYAPIYIAREQGYFAKQGLDVQVTSSTGGSAAFAAVLGGSGDVASAAFENNVQSAQAGHPLVAFAALMNRYSNELVMQKSTAQKLGVSASSPMDQKIKALKGLKIGITSAGSATDDTLRFMLKRVGLDPDRDVQITPLKQDSVALAAFEHGQVQAMLYPSPAPQEAIAKGSAVSLLNLADGTVPGLDHYLFITLLASDKWINGHQDAAKKLAAAIGQAETLIKEHPDQASASLRKYFPSLSGQAFSLAFKANLPAYATDPGITDPEQQAVLKFLGVQGKVDLTTVSTNQYAGGQ